MAGGIKPGKETVVHPGSETRFLFNIAGTGYRVLEFSTIERISLPYSTVLTLVSEENVDLTAAVGQEAVLKIIGEEEDRFLHGIISEFSQTGGKGRFLFYRAVMVPALWLLSLEQDCRIFQNMTVPDMVKQILTDAGIPADRFDFRVQGQYQPREYCVQYRETDLDFISRVIEEEGIFYIFEHAHNQHLMVFCDDKVHYQTVPGTPELEYHPPDARVTEGEFVTRFAWSRQVRTGKVVLNDYNFEKPSVNLAAQKEDKESPDREVYDYPGKYATDTDGKKRAAVRLQEAVTYTEQGEGEGTAPCFLPGFTFKLVPDDEWYSGEYLLVQVDHSGLQPQVLEEEADPGASFHYTNQFASIPSSVVFRPERKTPRARMEGVQTAIVVGPAGEEIYTDKHGRVKVQFHWDREGKEDEKSSCWVRVSQVWAGAGWGAMHIPRIGQEVIVSFEEGDPDRPLITGRVYHGTNVPPYSLPDEKTKSTIKSDSTPGGGGSNEIRFEDKKGEEEVYLHGQKDWTILIENDKNQVVGNNETLSVGVDKSDSIGANKNISVGANHTESIGANMSLTVGSNKSETISIASAETVGAAKALTIGAGYQVTVGAVMNETVGGAKMEEVGAYRMESVGGKKTEKIGGEKSLSTGKNYSIAVGKNMSIAVKEKGSLSVSNELDIGTEKQLTIKAKDSILIQSDKDITLKAGKAQLILKKDGKVEIKGNKINVKGSGDVKIKGSKVGIN